MFADEFFKIWHVLEEVGIQLFVVKSHIRFYIIGEFYNFKFNTFFSNNGLACSKISPCGTGDAPTVITVLPDVPADVLLSLPQPANSKALPKIAAAANENNFFHVSTSSK